MFEYKKLVMFFGLVLACLVFGSSTQATIVIETTGSEREFVANWIETAKDPIYIRASTIHDPRLISAIQKGSRNKRIEILLDQVSPEVQRLVIRRNLDIHILPKEKQKQKLTYSTVLEVGKDHFQSWSGKPIITSSIFKNKFEFCTGCGFDIVGGLPGMKQRFQSEFVLGRPVNLRR